MSQFTPRVRVLFSHCRRQAGLLVFGVLSVLIAISILGTQPAQAATNGTLNFQARLQTNGGGQVADGFYNIQFNLYDVSGGGSSLWTETYLVSNTQGVRVKNGYVSVNLGSLTSFPTTINWDQELWLGITVRGTGSCSFGACTPTDSEMAPRLKLTGLPYAFRAGELAKYNSVSGYTSILRLQNATGGNQIFEIPNQNSGNTFTLLTTNAADAAYIQNTTSPQTANFNITGNGTIGTNLSVSGNFAQTGSGTFGTATGAISLNGDTTVASGKTLTVAAGASSLTGPSGGSSLALAVGSGATSNVGLRVSAVSSQTANILEVIDGASNAVLTIAATGKASFAAKPTATGSDGTIELGSTASQSSNDINGVIGFLGTGVGHAQIAYSVGDGFYLCNSSSSSPSGDYGQCSSRVNLYGQTGDFNSGLNITGGNIVQSGSGTFATATGAISLNGDATVAAGKTLRFANGSNSNIVTIQSGVTSSSYSLTLPTTLGASGDCLKDTNGSGVLGFASCGGGSGVTTVGAFSGSSQTNGASISGATITFGPADGTNPGMVTTGAQTIAGAKTFSSNIIGQAGLSVTGATTLTADAVGTIPLTVQGAASQTANLLEVKNQSGGTTVLSIAKDGSGVFQGVQPASTAGNGTNAGNGSGNSYEIKGANGGNTTGTFNSAGNGGAITITAGNGGVGTNGGIVNGGNGGNIVIQGGTGGSGVGGALTGLHGNVLLAPTDVGFVGIRTTTNNPANPLTINDRVENSSTGTNDAAAQLMVFMGSSNSNKGIVAQGRASQTGNLFEGQNSSGTALFSVSSVGAIVGVGINSGTGLIQGTGGATITGAVALNTTGTANTQIGNATGTFQLDSNALDISSAGAISGATDLTMGGNFSQTGSGTFSTATGAISLNGDTTIANDKRLSIGSTSGLASALAVTAPGGTELNVKTNGGLRVSVGNTANCTSGRFCVEQEVNGATAGTFYNNYNVQTINSTGGSNVITGIGQSISISDTGSTSGNTIRGLFLDTTGTSNTNTEINGLWVRNPSSNSGNLLRLQTGTTDRYLVSNTAALAHTYGATGSSTAHTLTLNSASGTQANGILVDRNGSGGTTTNGIHISNTAGAITHGLTFSGTFSTTLINAPNFTVTNAGGITGSALTLTSVGNFATQRNTTDFTTTGTSNNVNLGTGALFRLNGASAQTITGLAGGADGRRITIVNAAAQAATISNNSGSSTAANRITTGTGTDLSLPSGGSIELIYDSSASLWRVVGGAAGSGGSGVTTIGTFNSGTSYANGAQISSNTLTLGAADASNPGLVSTSSQTIAGAKTFSGNIIGQSGLSVIGATIELNVNSNNPTNINTGTSTGLVSIGGGAGTFALDTTNIDISSAGAISGATGYTQASGNFDASASNGNFLTSTGNVTLGGNTTVASGKSFTANGTALFKNNTDSTTAFQIQNANGTNIVNVETLQDPTNVITNPSIEVNTTGWTARTGTTNFARTTSEYYTGAASLGYDSNAIGEGANYAIQLTPSTAYVMQVYVKATSASTSLRIGYAHNGSDETTYLSSISSYTNGGWTRVRYEFTTPGSVAANAYMFITSTSATARTFYLDTASITALGSGFYPVYSEGQIQLNGVVTTPLSLLNTTDSTNAFEIQNTSYGRLFNADTVNGTVTIGNIVQATSTAAKLFVNATATVGMTVAQNGAFDILRLNDTSGTVLTVADEGAITAKNQTNSAAAFQVQNTGNISQLTVDTSASQVILGTSGGDTTGTLLVLGNKTNAGDPGGVAGAMYYNSSLGTFRCYDVNYWRDCLQSPRTSYRYDQEFTITRSPWDGWPIDGTFDFASNSDAGINQVTAEASHPGIVQFQTGTTNSGWVSAWMWDQNNSNVVFGSDYWRFETVLRIPVLSGVSSQTFYVRAGFMDSNGTNSDGTDGCFFRYTNSVNGGRWQGVCNNNGTTSTCDTGTSPSSAPVTNTWYRLGVVVNSAGTLADFRINGSSRCTVNTNIPTGSTRSTSAQIVVSKTGGTSQIGVDVDYMGWESQFTTSR